MIRAIFVIAAATIAASVNAGSISLDTTSGVSSPWTVSVPSLSVSGATPQNGYLSGSITPFSGAGEDCSTTPCSFDGFWTATLTFTLPADATNVELSFSGLDVDDRGVLELNGTIIGNTYDGEATSASSGFMTFTDGGMNQSYSFGGSSAQSGTIMSGFNIGGLNTLLLIVNNTQAGQYGSPSGIGFTAAGVDGTVTFDEPGSPVPEPGSLVLLSAVLPALALLRGRRARK